MKISRVAAALAALALAIGIGVGRFVPSGSAMPDAASGGASPDAPRATAPDAGSEVQAPEASAATARLPESKPRQRLLWRRSEALGLPYAGRLVRGVQLPAFGRHHFTWDPILERSPGRWWRRWGTHTLVRKVLRIARAYRQANPGAPRLTVGDLSRPRGGDFGPRFGLPGHASHQNGLDVDIYYPRLDRVELRASHPDQIDRRLGQDLVDRFVAAGAEYVFVGPSTGLEGPPSVVQVLALHDDHMHVRLPPD